MLYRFVVFDDSMLPSAPVFCNWCIRFAWLGIGHVIRDEFSHNSRNTGCLWAKCYFEIEACRVDIVCVCEFCQFLWKHVHCSQVLVRRCVHSSLLHMFSVVGREGGGVCASNLRFVSGSRMPDMMRVVRRSSMQTLHRSALLAISLSAI